METNNVAKDILKHVSGIKSMILAEMIWIVYIFIMVLKKFNVVEYEWNDKNCVKEHTIKSMNVFFCLNCDNWIKDKAEVLTEG